MTEITDGAALAALLYEDVPADKPAEDVAQDAPPAADEGAKEAEAQEPESKEDDAAEEPVYVVKMDGKEFEITESELLQGYQRQADYTRKTQELADQRRQHQEQSAAEIAALKRAAGFYALPTSVEPKPEDYPGQPDKFVAAYNEYRQGEERRTKAAQLLEHLTAEETRRVVARELDLLNAVLPEWATPSVRDADLSRIREVGTSRYGFSEDELASVTDHRIILLLRDASRVAALDSKPIEMQRKTAIEPKMKPGTKAKMNTVEIKRKVAMDKLKSSGRLSNDEQVALLFDT